MERERGISPVQKTRHDQGHPRHPLWRLRHKALAPVPATLPEAVPRAGRGDNPLPAERHAGRSP